jgi:Uma2 family endonuclease
LLVVEVADSSIEIDRQIKVPRHARGEVTEVWLIDLERDVVVVYRDPSGDTYRQAQVVRRGEVVAPAAFSDMGLPVDALLG